MGGGYDPGGRKTGGDTQGFSSLLDEVSQHRFQRQEAGESELFPGGRGILAARGPQPWPHPGRRAAHQHLLQGVHKGAVKGSPNLPDSPPAKRVQIQAQLHPFVGLRIKEGSSSTWAGAKENRLKQVLPKPHQGYFHPGRSLKRCNLEPSYKCSSCTGNWGAAFRPSSKRGTLRARLLGKGAGLCST